MPRKGRKNVIILEAARLFAEKGYASTTVRDVGAAVGMGSGSLYAHYSSKAEILFDIIKSNMDEAIDRLRPIVESDKPADLKLRLGIAAHIDRPKPDTMVVRQWTSLDPVLREQIRVLRKRYASLCNRLSTKAPEKAFFMFTISGLPGCSSFLRLTVWTIGSRREDR
jgi:AcrR family transcriptional regulator